MIRRFYKDVSHKVLFRSYRQQNLYCSCIWNRFQLFHKCRYWGMDLRSMDLSHSSARKSFLCTRSYKSYCWRCISHHSRKAHLSRELSRKVHQKNHLDSRMKEFPLQISILLYDCKDCCSTGFFHSYILRNWLCIHKSKSSWFQCKYPYSSMDFSRRGSSLLIQSWPDLLSSQIRFFQWHHDREEEIQSKQSKE